MRARLPFALFVSALLLTGCSWFRSAPTTGTGSSADSASSEQQVTRNVNYTGTVETLGVSIYQQGSHKLVLDDGRFILLVSSDASLDLRKYLGQRVEVRGSVRPAVEGGTTIMSVEQVTVLQQSSSSLASSTMTGSSPSVSSSSLTVSSVAVSSLPASSSHSSSLSSSVHSASSASSSLAEVSSSAITSSLGGGDEQQIILVAKQNYGDAFWTQKYCTSHISFCIPAQKNWFYTSFGAKATSLWHVEFGMGAIEKPGDGVIFLDLVGSTSASMNASDGATVAQGTRIVGYKDWSGKHFEISGDARLRAPIEYMLSHITAYTATE